MHYRSSLSMMVVLAVCLGMAISTIGAKEPGESDGKLIQLLTERRDTVKELLSAVRSSFSTGNTDYKALVEVENELLDIELELATSPADRLVIREELVENMKRAEELFAKRFMNGTARNTEVLRAKAERLKAEIDLQRERIASR